ncbi:MAG: WbqC family protein [Muribaculaceae bacterium]
MEVFVGIDYLKGQILINNNDIVPTCCNTLMSSAYAGSVRYYAAMLKAQNVDINATETHLDKEWGYHHCNIAGANGVQTLTIPIVKPIKGSLTPLNEIRISTHGDWERIHWGALFSAYGKSPFFEYIESDLHKLYMNHSNWIIDFNESLHNLIIDFLDFPIKTERVDVSHIIEKGSDIAPIKDVEYYQLWKSRHGFLSNLSILDLLMNTGRESIFILQKMMQI